MLKNRQELLDCAQHMYEAQLTKAANRYYTNAIYTQLDRAGLECTKLEELFRPMWGLAPVLRERKITLNIQGNTVDLADFYRDLMVNGTDPNSPRRFDRNVTEFDLEFFSNQSVTEIAGYLTCVFFAREILWDPMTKAEQDQIADWIVKWAVYAVKHSWPNNHYWYPIICIEILKHLGYDLSEADKDMQIGFDVLDSLYIDKGWYSDGEFGRFDYYEAWAHHCYTLLYILIGDKNRPDYEDRCRTYKARSQEFLEFFSHYFDSDGGMVAYGRSICYRFAAVSAYGLAAAVGCDMDYGMAKRLILRNISYFFDNSIMEEDGILPDGYLYNAYSFVESYTSEGSNSCYTEGFLCLLCGEDSPLWQAEETRIPIEKGPFLLECPVEGIDFVLSGDNDKYGVTIYNNSLHYYQEPFFTKRFNDMAGYYSKFVYNSRSGYSLSTRDLVSAENMICLFTPDGRMFSHRQEIKTISTSSDLLVSEHIPFSNDPATKIRTSIVPLQDGWHVRVHEVELSQSYLVMEGGFSVGVLDDAFSATAGQVSYGKEISRLEVVSDVPCKLASDAAHPGMHLLKPRSYYPCYTTQVLPAGTYRFACAVCYVTDGETGVAPVMAMEADCVKIDFHGKQYKVTTQ